MFDENRPLVRLKTNAERAARFEQDAQRMVREAQEHEREARRCDERAKAFSKQARQLRGVHIDGR